MDKEVAKKNQKRKKERKGGKEGKTNGYNIECG
jgi:hypothetical protein